MKFNAQNSVRKSWFGLVEVGRTRIHKLIPLEQITSTQVAFSAQYDKTWYTLALFFFVFDYLCDKIHAIISIFPIDEEPVVTIRKYGLLLSALCVFLYFATKKTVLLLTIKSATETISVEWNSDVKTHSDFLQSAAYKAAMAIEKKRMAVLASRYGVQGGV